MLLLSLPLLLLTEAATPHHRHDVPEEGTGKERLPDQQAGHQLLFTAEPHLLRLRVD